MRVCTNITTPKYLLYAEYNIIQSLYRMYPHHSLGVGVGIGAGVGVGVGQGLGVGVGVGGWMLV